MIRTRMYVHKIKQKLGNWRKHEDIAVPYRYLF